VLGNGSWQQLGKRSAVLSSGFAPSGLSGYSPELLRACIGRTGLVWRRGAGAGAWPRGAGPGGMARPWLAQAGGAGSDAGACCGRGARAGAGEWVAEPRWHCRACAGKALAQLPGSAPEPGSAPGAAASARARRRDRSAQAARVSSSSRQPPRPAAVSGRGRTIRGRLACWNRPSATAARGQRCGRPPQETASRSRDRT
jgi:hypothetical protein